MYKTHHRFAAKEIMREKTLTTKIFTKVVALLLLAFFALYAQPSIVYHGYLTEGGIPITAVKSFWFEVITSNETVVWNSGKMDISVNAGSYEAALNISPSLINPGETYKLRVALDSASSYLSPNSDLYSVPYAYYAYGVYSLFGSLIASNATPVEGSTIEFKGGVWTLDTDAGAGSALSGSGFSGSVGVFVSADTINASIIIQTNTNIGIGTNNPISDLHVAGDIRGSSFVLENSITSPPYQNNAVVLYAKTNALYYISQSGEERILGEGVLATSSVGYIPYFSYSNYLSPSSVYVSSNSISIGTNTNFLQALYVVGDTFVEGMLDASNINGSNISVGINASNITEGMFTAYENIALNGKRLSYNGDDNGLYLFENGAVGIGTNEKSTNGADTLIVNGNIILNGSVDGVDISEGALIWNRLSSIIDEQNLYAIPRWTGSAFSPGIIYDRASNVGVGTTNMAGLFTLRSGLSSNTLVIKSDNYYEDTIHLLVDSNGFMAMGANEALAIFHIRPATNEMPIVMVETNDTNTPLFIIASNGMTGFGILEPNFQVEISGKEGGFLGLSRYSESLSTTIGKIAFLQRSPFDAIPSAYIQAYTKDALSTTADSTFFEIAVSGLNEEPKPRLTISGEGQAIFRNEVGQLNIGFMVGQEGDIVVLGNGNVGIGGKPSEKEGVILKLGGEKGGFYDGTWHIPSDRSLKKNIRTLREYGLKEILSLNPVTYSYIKDKDEKKRVGFVAQEVREVLPEAVEGEEGTLTLSYENISPVVVRAIQEQQEEIERLKKENRVLKEQIAEIYKILGEYKEGSKK